MSQMTFDGFIEESGESSAVPLSTATSQKPIAAWYQGRVLSHSSINMYRACPQRWKFRYIDKIPEKPKSFFSFGKSVHAPLEFLFSRLQGVQPTLDELLAYYKEKWIREGYETPAQEKWFFQEGDRILRGFFAKHRLDFKRVLQAEFKFTAVVEGIPLTGFIDRIDTTEKGGLAIVDYKTGKAFDKVRVRADPQLTLYQIACRDLFDKPVETVTLYHLNSLTPLTVPAHSTDMEEALKSVVVETARGISDGKFDPKPDEKGQCQWCDYRQICPVFKDRPLTPAAAASQNKSLAEAADRYARLGSKIDELSAERKQVAETLMTHMEVTHSDIVEGRHFSVQLKPAEGSQPAALEAKPLQEGLPT